MKILKEILIELKSINKKLDAKTPSLDMNGIVDRLAKKVEEELLNKKEIDYLKEVADKEIIVAFSSHKPLEQQQQ